MTDLKYVEAVTELAGRLDVEKDESKGIKGNFQTFALNNWINNRYERLGKKEVEDLGGQSMFSS